MALPVLLLERLLNFAPWTYRWLGWFSDSIARIEGALGYESLRNRLVAPTKSDEACSVLQVAERLAAADLKISFDVPAEVNGAMKVPDIGVKDEAVGIAFHCEVSVLYSARAQVNQWRICDRIAQALVFQSDVEGVLRFVWHSRSELPRNSQCVKAPHVASILRGPYRRLMAMSLATREEIVLS